MPAPYVYARLIARNMNDCDLLVACIYIVSACIVVYSVNVKCRADIADVERHSLKNGVVRWYVFRIAAVVVIFGALMHGRYVVGQVLDSLFFKKSA
jgi:TRAP-type mannitol/chloroaromatic compound transport system permease small subunit